MRRKFQPLFVAWAVCSCASSLFALPIDLGTAGPGYWAVLETGAKATNANVSIANASNAGYINGNIGFSSTGNLSDSGTPIDGNVYVKTTGTLNSNVTPNVDGFVYQNATSDSVLYQAKLDAAAAATAASLLSSTAITSISSTMTMTGGGVYSLASIALNNETLTLSGSASSYYVFNISDSMTLSHSSILLTGGLTENNVLFNITRVGGTGVGLSGGLDTESIIHGIVMANKSQIQITPGLIIGEIIGGDNISIASGAQIQGYTPHPVPDSGSTFILTASAFAALALARRLFQR